MNNLNQIINNLTMATRPGQAGSRSALTSANNQRPMVGRNSLFKEVAQTKINNNSGINGNTYDKSPIPNSKTRKMDKIEILK